MVQSAVGIERPAVPEACRRPPDNLRPRVPSRVAQEGIGPLPSTRKHAYSLAYTHTFSLSLARSLSVCLSFSLSQTIKGKTTGPECYVMELSDRKPS